MSELSIKNNYLLKTSKLFERYQIRNYFANNESHFGGQLTTM